MTKIRRIIKTGLLNFFRNGWLSLTATLIMSLALLSVGMFLIIALSTNQIVHDLKDKVDIVVNFKDSASEALIYQLKSDLMVRPEIKSVEYVSKEDALAEFKSRSSVKQEVRDIVTAEDNPLPRGLKIQSVDLEEYDYVAELIKKPVYANYIDSSSYDDNKTLIENINQSIKFIERIGIALSTLFILIAALVIFNTVRLTVVFRAEEIEIMRLVGASETFVRVPFLIEGFLYGFFALIVSEGLIFGGAILSEKISSSTVFEKFIAKILPIYYSNFSFILIMLAIVGTVIGVGASYMSLRRHVGSRSAQK